MIKVVMNVLVSFDKSNSVCFKNIVVTSANSFLCEFVVAILYVGNKLICRFIKFCFGSMDIYFPSELLNKSGSMAS